MTARGSASATSKRAWIVAAACISLVVVFALIRSSRCGSAAATVTDAEYTGDTSLASLAEMQRTASKTATLAAAVQQLRGNDVLQLPEPRYVGDVSLEEALNARHSVREFAAGTARELTLDHIGQLFWAAQGVTHGRHQHGRRTAPSAGALYPLELYAATPHGLLHYLPHDHTVALVTRSDVRAALARAGPTSSSKDATFDNAQAVIVVTGVEARTARKYSSRAKRYVRLEAGHAAQNVLLQATALRLGAVVEGAFHDSGVHSILQLADGEEPLYLLPLGVPAVQ